MLKPDICSVLRRRLLLPALAGLALFAPCDLTAAPLAGKAWLDGAGVAGVTVGAWPLETPNFSGAAPFRAGPTTDDGQFLLDLPPGQYYLLAESTELASFYGRNPIAVPAEGLANINLLMVPRTSPPPAAPVQIDGGVAGRITHQGEAVAAAVVFVYPDLSSQFKGFGLAMAPPTGADGLFEIPLPAGTYYLVARLRQGGQFSGPLGAGDLFGYAPLNPVVVREGQVVRVTIPLIEVPEKISRHSGTLFGQTRVTGRIVDVSGQPVAGLRALLYSDPQMLNRPLYVSAPTAADGRFVLSFPEGGAYYLAARSQLGGTPAPGELYGRYQGAAEPLVRLKTGELLEGVEIVVEEVW